MIRYAPLFVLASIAMACTPPRRDLGQVEYTALRAETPRPAPCPLGVVDAEVVAADTADGIVVTFISKEHGAELRERAFDVSAQYGARAHRGRGHDGKHGGQSGRHGLETMTFPPSNIEPTALERGASLRIVPKWDGDRDRLRSAVHRRVSQMKATPCE